MIEQLANLNDAQLIVMVLFALVFLWKGAGMDDNDEVRGALIIAGCFFAIWGMATCIGNIEQERKVAKGDIFFQKRGSNLTFHYRGDGKLVESVESDVED